MKKILVLLMGMMLLTACATTNTKQDSGFLGEYSKNMQPSEEKGRAKLAWIKPGVDFSKFKKVMVDYVSFVLSEDSEYKGINADEMKKIADEASLALANAVQKKFPVVSDPGPDVIRVRVAITDLKQSRPVLSGITTVVPVGLGISLISKGTTGAWTGSGATTAEIMVMDSMTSEVLAVAMDQKAAGFTERFSKWGSVEDAFDYWGETVAKRLVELSETK